MSDKKPQAAPEPTPFEKFKSLARKLIAVPKKEIADKEKEAKVKKDRQAKK